MTLEEKIEETKAFLAATKGGPGILRRHGMEAVFKLIGCTDRAYVTRFLEAGDFQRALETAREIVHPWYRCQSLAMVAAHDLTHEEAQAIIDESFDAAFSQSVLNRIAAVSKWPLEVQLKLCTQRSEARVNQFLAIIVQEPHGLRRLNGLRAILIGVACNEKLRNRVLKPIFTTAVNSHGWRTERHLWGCIFHTGRFDPEMAAKLVALRPQSRFTRRAVCVLARNGIVVDFDS